MLNTFKKTLIEAYYYIMIADGLVDPRELSFGNLMIEKEEITREDFEKELDEMSITDVGEIKEKLKTSMQSLTKEQQLRLVAYMVKIADADGTKDPSEMTSIQKVMEGLDLHINDIIKMKQQLF